MSDQASYEKCDFTNAVPLVPEGQPNPNGYRISSSSFNVNFNNVMYFSCSKICQSNHHKVKICVGDEGANKCTIDTGDSSTADIPDNGCTFGRTIDLRRIATTQIMPSSSSPPQREYLAVGRVCRPKNSDGYDIASGIDTPETCRQKCDNDSSKCGAWEYEDYKGGDDKECELHERNVVSYTDTKDMGECVLPLSESEDGGSDDYRCCWIAEDVINAAPNADNSSVGASADLDAKSSPCISIYTCIYINIHLHFHIHLHLH